MFYSNDPNASKLTATSAFTLQNIRMKSNLARVATLALAFMVFTASAQNVTVYEPTACGADVPPNVPYGAVQITTENLLNNSCDFRLCSVLNNNISSVSIYDPNGDVTCYFWEDHKCGRHGSYNASAKGAVNPLCTSFTTIMSSWQCFVGVC